jgi:hypothetical protein
MSPKALKLKIRADPHVPQLLKEKEMSAMPVVTRCGRRVLLLTFLPLLWLAVAEGATNSSDVNDVSPEERAALKNQPCSNIMKECEDKKVPLERIARLLTAKLKDESILETLSKLEEPGFEREPAALRFVARSFYKSGVPLPKDSDYCAGDLLAVLNNPRFVKLVQELPRMPRSDMASIMVGNLEASLVLYDKWYQWFLQDALKGSAGVKNDPSGKASPMPTVKTDVHERVLVLLMLAGHLQLREGQPAIQKIVDYAIRQRDRLYDRTQFGYDFAASTLDQLTLYHRQILATALLQTSLTRREAEQALAAIGAKYQERKVKPYDQMLTLVHLPHLRKGEKMKTLRVLDDENGTIGIRVVEELDDSQFNRLVEAVKSARAQGGTPQKDAVNPNK